jgi:non-ribosomal peptide synthase protein (TIGR01720 family)
VLSVYGEWRAIVGSNGGERATGGSRSHQLEITGIVTGGRLQATFTYSRNLHRKETIELRAGRFFEKLRGLVSHCRQLETRSFSPSDFPAARIDQKTLDTLISQLNSD